MNFETKYFWIFFLLLLFILIFFKSKNSAKHFKTLKTAKKVYKKINFIKNQNTGWLFSYLRKIDPFVFEELILLSFKKKGFRVKRNKRYTHDGGIDGRCIRNRETFLIQAKRYSEYIKEEHVRQFIYLCGLQNKRGYFIHTGKTGNETKELIKQNPQIKLISGDKLYKFFIENNEDCDYLYF